MKKQRIKEALMNYSIRYEKKYEINEGEAEINVAFGETRATNEFMENLFPFLEKRLPLRINIQESDFGPADVLIETQTDSKFNDGFKVLIKDGYSFNFSGEGSRGLVKILDMFDIPQSKTEPIITTYNPKLEDKRIIISISE